MPDNQYTIMNQFFTQNPASGCAVPATAVVRENLYIESEMKKTLAHSGPAFSHENTSMFMPRPGAGCTMPVAGHVERYQQRVWNISGEPERSGYHTSDDEERWTTARPSTGPKAAILFTSITPSFRKKKSRERNPLDFVGMEYRSAELRTIPMRSHTPPKEGVTSPPPFSYCISDCIAGQRIADPGRTASLEGTPIFLNDIL